MTARWPIPCGTGPCMSRVKCDHRGEYMPGLEWPPYDPEETFPQGVGETDTSAGDADSASDPDSWTGIDLGPYLRGEIPRIIPTIGGWREDGTQMLYPGCEHSCLGEMESGKSWFALAHVAAELLAQRHVIYVHFEESSPADTISRLLDLGVNPAAIAKHLTFIAPDRPVQ